MLLFYSYYLNIEFCSHKFVEIKTDNNNPKDLSYTKYFINHSPYLECKARAITFHSSPSSILYKHYMLQQLLHHKL